jgi:proteasome lid subunit RPN8/RPN11
MDEMRPVFTLRRQHWQQMHSDVAGKAPLEACGLVAGLTGRSMAVYPVFNELESPVRFRMDPEGQIRAMIAIEEQGWELAAIYHSHPEGPDHPSPTDISEAMYPETVQLIWFRREGRWQCLGYLIEGEQVRRVDVEFETGE